MGLSGERSRSGAGAEGLAARRTGRQGRPWQRAARAARPRGLPQATPPGALIPQEHPKPEGHPTSRMQVRGWKLLAEPAGRRTGQRYPRLGHPKGGTPSWLPRAPQSQTSRALNAREYLCSGSGTVREIATACNCLLGASNNSKVCICLKHHFKLPPDDRFLPYLGK